MRPLGTVDNKYTFRELMDKGYLPFTLPELVGTDPVEPGEAYLGTAQKRVENGQDITLKELFSNDLNTNYALCTVDVQVKNPAGEVLFSYKPIVRSNPNTYAMPMNTIDLTEQLTPLANGSNTIHVYARMANGELLEAVHTILKVN